MLTLPCKEAFVEGTKPELALLLIYGEVHAHDFRITLSREKVETLRESCEVYLKTTADMVLDPEQFARSVINEVCAPIRRDPDAA